MSRRGKRLFWEGNGLWYTSLWINSAEHTEFWFSRCLGVIGQQLDSHQPTLDDNLAQPCSDMIMMHSYPAVMLLIGWQSNTKDPEFISNGEAHLQTCSSYKKGFLDTYSQHTKFPNSHFQLWLNKIFVLYVNEASSFHGQTSASDIMINMQYH